MIKIEMIKIQEYSIFLWYITIWIKNLIINSTFR